MHKTLLITGWAVTAVVALKVLPVSWIAINPTAVEIIGDQVQVYRTFPMDALGLPRPHISYTETVKPLTQSHNGGQFCDDAGKPVRYSRPEAVGKWSIPWAADCLNDPQGYCWEARWTWHIGGLSFGPVSPSKTVINQR